MSFGQLVERERCRRGWTQSQLAETLKMDRASVSNIECDRKRPSIDALNGIIAALGIDPAEALSLLGGHGSSSADDLPPEKADDSEAA